MHAKSITFFKETPVPDRNSFGGSELSHKGPHYRCEGVRLHCAVSPSAAAVPDFAPLILGYVAFLDK